MDMGCGGNTAGDMNIVLIGGSGGVGTELMRVIDHAKYNVKILRKDDFNVAFTEFHQYLADADVVVNLAGVFDANPLDMVLVNCYGAYNVITLCSGFMKERSFGRIIMMSSVFSTISMPQTAMYSASKAFIDKLVSVMALENAEYGVTINSIQLGYTGVGMGARVSNDVYIKSKNKPAMKRFCSSEEIYRTIEYIIETPYLTGAHIRLDGGVR